MPRHGVDRQAARRDIRAAQLPVAEVSGDDDQALAAREALLDDAPAMHLFEEVDDLRGAVRRQHRGLDRRATQMPVGGACNAPDLVARLLGKYCGELTLDDGAANVERRETEPADALADHAGAVKPELLHRRDG